MSADVDAGIRVYNRGRVVAALRSAVALTRSDIGKMTGLSRATVTSLVSELLSDGILRPVAQGTLSPEAGRPGRRAELLAIRERPGHAIAMDIAHETLRVAVSGTDGIVRRHLTKRIEPSAGPDQTVDEINRLIRELTASLGIELDESIGVVAAVPDPIDAAGNVARPDPWSRWDGRNPSRMLSERLGVSVLVENDANLAVIGEHLYGSARRIQDVIYVKVAHGVGTGIMANGQLLRGSNGLAGEVGHIQVRPDGRICSCGNRGCLFTLVTGSYLGSLLGDSSTGIDGLTAKASRNDPGANRLLKDAGYEVGKVLANLANALNPGAVILGGRLAHIGDSLLDGFRDAVERHAEPQAARSLAITRTRLQERAELLGAAAVASGIASGRALAQ